MCRQQQILPLSEFGCHVLYFLRKIFLLASFFQCGYKLRDHLSVPQAKVRSYPHSDTHSCRQPQSLQASE